MKATAKRCDSLARAAASLSCYRWSLMAKDLWQRVQKAVFMTAERSRVGEGLAGTGTKPHCIKGAKTFWLIWTCFYVNSMRHCSTWGFWNNHFQLRTSDKEDIQGNFRFSLKECIQLKIHFQRHFKILILWNLPKLLIATHQYTTDENLKKKCTKLNCMDTSSPELIQSMEIALLVCGLLLQSCTLVWAHRSWQVRAIPITKFNWWQCQGRERVAKWFLQVLRNATGGCWGASRSPFSRQLCGMYLHSNHTPHTLVTESF